MMERRKRSKFISHLSRFFCFYSSIAIALAFAPCCDVVALVATAYRSCRGLIGDWHKPRPLVGVATTMTVMMAN